MRRTLTLSTTLAISGVVIYASSFGSFGYSRTHAQEALPNVSILTDGQSGERIQQSVGTARVLAGEAQTKGAFVVVDSSQPPDSWTPMHAHDYAESWYVLEGTLTVQINDDGTPRELPAGSYVYVPGGVRHAAGNKGKVIVRTILTTQRPGVDRLFRREQEEFRAKLLEAQERAAKERAAKERAAKERAAKERAAKERAAKERAAKERQGNP